MKKLCFGFMLFCSLLHTSHAAELSCKTDYDSIISPDLLKISEELKNNHYDILKQKTHSSLIQFSGGEHAYAELLDVAKSFLDQANIKIMDVQLKPPLDSYQVGNEELCFIPKQISMKMAGQDIQSPPSFFIAVRPLDAHVWTYLDGAGLQQDPQLIFTLFPSFPKEVTLPFQPVAE